MYVFTVLFEKHSSQSITLVTLKSSWFSSKVLELHQEDFRVTNVTLCKTKMNVF